MKPFLIAGLGNPGKSYEKTRHNVGFRVVGELARRHNLTLRKKLLIKGRVAQGLIQERPVILLLPETYMNLSGEVVAKVMRKMGVDIDRLLVIVDDIALPFGQLRLRESSGSGGHNGLKSVEACLGTNSYARLRVGVGDRQEGDLSSHVLGPFAPEEEKLVPQLLERAATVAEIWLTDGLTSAMKSLTIHPNHKERK